MLYSLFGILCIILFLLLYPQILHPSVDVELTTDVADVINVQGCRWQDSGIKYKCTYTNITDQNLERASIKATAFDKANQGVSTIFFPKYRKIEPQETYDESIAKIQKSYEIDRIKIELH
jgi:hypothetical protein